ncbi:MAG TPA: helix-turn-helix domain-containing protein [Vicinamibacteria bacterium]|nr:helix-turn-helix domain-containing protein [Vicinamibacteria bacterium]
MQYRELRPSEPYRDSVECVWIVEGASSVRGPCETIVPDGCAELILHLGERFAGGFGGALVTQPRAILVGPLSRPFLVSRPRGPILTLGVRFRPGGLRAYLHAPVHELAEIASDGRAVFGRSAASLAEALFEARDDAARLRLVEDFLGERRRASRLQPGLVGQVLASRGRIRSDALARAAGLSLRQLERLFREAVGLSPKRLSRIVRFQEVLRRTGDDAADWVSVALDCGYFDQSHLVRDFSELAGAAPSRFAGREGFAGNFIAPARLEAFFGA